MKVGPWVNEVLTDENGVARCMGAYRAILGTDGDDIANRVAFVEKTPRIRIRRMVSTRGPTSPTGEENDWLNWAVGPIKGDGPEDVEAREWCDTALVLFGYEVPDPTFERLVGNV